MKAHIYKLTCLTNLHVGNGDANYSIIDNEVEKDLVLGGEPIIPSSGVKGALLSYLRENKIEISPKVFGNGENRGEYKFLTASILGRPIRVSDGKRAFAIATTKTLLENYNEMCSALDIDEKICYPSVDEGTNGFCFSSDISSVEGFNLAKGNPDEWKDNGMIGKNVVLLRDDVLSEIALPVAARNSLDVAGKSKNLWYEEFVPHHSVFYMIIITPDEKNVLDEYINGKIVQFGADASVGYGLIKIEKRACNE